MEIKPIRTNADYERTLREVERLWGALALHKATVWTSS